MRFVSNIYKYSTHVYVYILCGFVSSPVRRTWRAIYIAIPRRQHQRENVKVFGASNVEACHSFNIHTYDSANIWHGCSLGV